MSLSINTPAFVNVDNGRLDQPAQPPAKLNVPSVATMPVPPVFNAQKGDITVDAGTLNKLFDMLELVFKALREMFAGKPSKPAVLPTKADVPSTKIDAGAQPLGRKTTDLPAVKPDALKQPAAPVASLLSQPATTGTPDAKAGDMPVLMREALKHLPGSIAPREIKPETADSHADKPADLPVTTRSALRPQLGSPLPQAFKPEVSVTNDAKANVHVNVNIDHRYCPDTKRLQDRGVISRVIPNVQVLPAIPDAEVQPEVTPRDEFEAKPKPALHVQPGLMPRMTPHTGHEVAPKPALELEPTPVPETTPPVEHHTTPTHLPEEPNVAITSTGPSVEAFERRDWRLNTRSNFKH